MYPPTYDFIHETIPDNVKEKCLQFPWFANLIKDPSLKSIQTPGRQSDYDGDCALISRTLNTPDTVAACQSFFKSPSPSLSPSSSSQQQKQDIPTDEEPANLGELQTFYCLGIGLEGHQGICHGGFLSMAIDHAMGSLARASSERKGSYTKSLHVDYRKPLYVRGPLLCRVWITKIQGRKLWIRGRMEGEDGEAYITAEGFFIRSGSRL